MSISVENLVFGYSEKDLLNGVSFSLEQGGFPLFVGTEWHG